MPPSEGPESAATTLLQRARERRDGDAHTHQAVVLRGVLHQGDELQVGHLQVHVDVLVNLLVRQLVVAIEILEGLVDELEDALAVAALEDIALLQFLDAQVVAFLNHLGNLAHLLRNLVGHEYLVFHVVVVLHVSRHCLHVLGVVLVVVDGGHGSQLVESPDEHALGVHVGESKWPHHGVHALLSSVVLNGFHQCGRHLAVVNEVYPPEAHGFLLPPFVGFMVDDGGNAAAQLPFLVGQEVLSLAEVEGGVAVFRQRVHVVAI